MASRSLLTFSIAILSFACRSQSCFTVVDAVDSSAIEGCVVLCGDGSPVGVSDAYGRICAITLCDRITLTAAGHDPTTMTMMDALLSGTVEMQRTAETLPEMTIEPWPRKEDRRALASTTTADSAQLHGFEQSGLRSALVWAPGVQWDERGHGGSQRLSVRGSLLRSVYGVRGVKVYWGPFPVTLADGSTPLELLDPQLVGNVDVVRSVGSPAFGSAPSGVLLADAPWLKQPGFRATFDASGGSDGYFKLAASANSRGVRSELGTGLLRMGNDGYREQEYANRDQLWIANRYRSKRDVLITYITGQQARWALPGSIDSLTAISDPRAPRAYSNSIDAHIEKQQVLAGIRNEMKLGRSLQVNSGIHAQLIDKVNPYGTTPASSGYKDEHIRDAGARLSLAQDTRWSEAAFAWEAGLEALTERDQLTEHTYAYGEMGDLRTDAVTHVRNLNAFVTTLTRLGTRTSVHIDLGVERTFYDHNDLLRNTDITASLPAISYPLFAVERSIGNDLRVHARYAEAVSRPSVWELLGTTGIFNNDLRPEHVREWELGAALGTDTSLFRMNVSGYLRSTEGLISAVISGTNTTYTNAGNAQQNGIELSADFGENVFARDRIDFLLNAALQDHWLKRTGTNSPIEVPGVPLVTTGGILRYRWHSSTTIEIGARSSSSVSASVNNTDRVPGYAVMHARLSHLFRMGAGQLSAFVHVENLLDAHYTAFVWISDPGRRYYNPAPGRSFFAGVSLTFGSSSAGR